MEEKKEKVPKLNFEFNIADADYQIDILQNKILEAYIRGDSRFRRAFHINYTMEFFQYLKDKARLKEPIHISVIGSTRGGKSYSMISVCAFIMACYGKAFDVDYICANAYEFLEKLKNMPQEKLTNSCFLIDEEKQAVYGYGSIAKKIKLQDVANIIAINNISTIMLNPNSWANKNANYGLRAFGRCFKTKTCRFMLYNLQAGGKQSELPMGNIYVLIFTIFLPKEMADELERLYLIKKKSWVMQEQRGEGDVLAELRKKSAESFCRDSNFLMLKKKKERMAYISQKLGSEWTQNEIEEILTLTSLVQQGVLDD